MTSPTFDEHVDQALQIAQQTGESTSVKGGRLDGGKVEYVDLQGAVAVVVFRAAPNGAAWVDVVACVLSPVQLAEGCEALARGLRSGTYKAI